MTAGKRRGRTAEQHPPPRPWAALQPSDQGQSSLPLLDKHTPKPGTGIPQLPLCPSGGSMADKAGHKAGRHREQQGQSRAWPAFTWPVLGGFLITGLHRKAPFVNTQLSFCRGLSDYRILSSSLRWEKKRRRWRRRVFLFLSFIS